MDIEVKSKTKPAGVRKNREKFVYSAAFFQNTAWGTRDPNNRMAYVRMQVYKTKKGLLNALDGWVGGVTKLKYSQEAYYESDFKRVIVIRTKVRD
jgi:hypothetical protein